MKTELILINISGYDRPGVTSALTEILARFDAQILDIGQADIHHSLSLGILFKTSSDVSGDIMKELLFKAYELSVKIRFTPITVEAYEEWVSMQGKNRWIITILGRKLTARHIALVSDEIARQGLNIDAIQRLTGRMPLDESETPQSKSCVEFSVRGNPRDTAEMQRRLMQISNTDDFDISLQQDNVFRRCRRLICFDMDSTLIETEVIDELAMRAGVGDQVKAITESAMRGEIDFCESFRRRVALLKGLDESVMSEIADNLPVTEGVSRMMAVLKRTGFKTAILSGGFTYFGNRLKQRFGFDYVYANELEIADGKLTGRYVGDIVDGKRKAELLRIIAQVENIDIAQTIAVGDGANDLPMLTTAGLGIAIPRQTEGQADRPPVDFDHRSRRRALFPRLQRLVYQRRQRQAMNKTSPAGVTNMISTILTELKIMRSMTMRCITAIFSALLLLMSASPGAASEPAREGHQSVGLVLSGGGAKGIAHIGVIKALEENDIPIDYITGTSMGSIVGGLYAAGYTPEEMLGLILSRPFSYWSTGRIDPRLTFLLTDEKTTPTSMSISLNLRRDTTTTKSAVPQSIISPLPMNFAFMDLFSAYTAQCGGDFDRLMVPFRCVASNVAAKHKKVLSSGSLGDAIRASMSFPAVFQPTEIDGSLLYDGGIYDNFPVDVMRQTFAPSIMIGVDVSTAETGPRPLSSTS